MAVREFDDEGEVTQSPVEFVRDVLGKIDDDHTPLSEWEANFMKDQKARIEQYGDGTRFSPKQMEVIRRVNNKY